MATRRKAVSRTKTSDLHSKLSDLKADLEALQNDVKGAAGEAGEVAIAKMNDTLASTMESATLMAERVEGLSADCLEAFQENVRNRPMVSCAVAMGVGALLGTILLRR